MTTAVSSTSLKRLRHDEIHPSLNNLRVDVGDVDDLAASILGVGLLEPLVVRKGTDGFELIAGARRHAAIGKLIKARQVDKAALWDCIVRTGVDDAVQTAAMIVENLHRQGLSPIEEFHGLLRLANDHGWSTDQIATATGIPKTTVKQRLSWAKLPAEKLDKLIARIGIGKVTELATLEAAEIVRLAKADINQYDVDDALRLKKARAELNRIAAQLRKKGHVVVDVTGADKASRFDGEPDAQKLLRELAAADTRGEGKVAQAEVWPAAKALELDVPVPTVFELSISHRTVRAYAHVLDKSDTAPGRRSATDLQRDEAAASQAYDKARAAWVERRDAFRLALIRDTKPAELTALVCNDILNEFVTDDELAHEYDVTDDQTITLLDFARQSAANLIRATAGVQFQGGHAPGFDEPAPERTSVDRSHYDAAGKYVGPPASGDEPPAGGFVACSVDDVDAGDDD